MFHPFLGLFFFRLIFMVALVVILILGAVVWLALSGR